MNYATDSTAIRALVIGSANSKTLTPQGDPAGLGQAFKDLTNSTPAAPILGAKRLRDEKIDGIVHQVVVLTLEYTLIDTVTNAPYKMRSTVTVKFPKIYTTNANITQMAVAIWTMLASTGTAGTQGVATSTASQLESAMLGDLR